MSCARCAPSVSVVSNSLTFTKWNSHDNYVFLLFRRFVRAKNALRQGRGADVQ